MEALMLEQPQLLLGPWTPQGKGRRRAIQAPDTGQFLGCVRAPLPSWLSWLGRQFQEVLETEDDSLLMTLWRPWGLARTWEVLDAEERRVGILFRNVLLDSYGRRLALAHHQNDRHGRFCDVQGNELAAFARQESGVLLTFHPNLEGNPFTRMIMLGAILSWG
jgi:hypothetical protein